MSSALDRIAAALERLAPAPPPLPDFTQAGVFAWDGQSGVLWPVQRPRRVALDLLRGVDSQKGVLLANVGRFASGLPANHALLWGARGCGKSALVKAVHAEVSANQPGMKLVEARQQDLATLLPALDSALRQNDALRFLVFVDDLSFERGDETYKALKTLLDGSVSGPGERVLVCVTSNRRHLINRAATDSHADLRPDETMDEQIALADRFGLWLGFHGMDQPTYLAAVAGYCVHYALNPSDPELERSALQWAAGRGGRSGRVAWQFVTDRAGALGRPLTT